MIESRCPLVINTEKPQIPAQMADPSSNLYSYQLQDEDHYRSNHYGHFASLSASGNAFNMASPVKEENKLQPIVMAEREVEDEQPRLLAPPAEKPVTVRRIDVLQYLVNSLAGKDKLTKILKYTLDLLRLLISNSRAGITRWDPTVLVYYKKVLQNFSVRSVVRHPVTISKILLVAIFENFESKANFVGQQLSTYRYILRFGGTPFRLVKMLQKLQQTELDRNKLQKLWLNESSLRDFLDLYYGICDEMVLLHKLQVWSHPGLYNWFSRHEVLSWQYDIVLSLKDTWLHLQTIQKKVIELNIQQRVRSKALKLSANLQGNPGYTSPIRRQLLSDLNNGNGNELDIQQRIEQLKQERKIAYLDLVRLTFDCMANSTDVFNLKTPPGTYAVLSLCSGITGLTKLWINARKELLKQSDS